MAGGYVWVLGHGAYTSRYLPVGLRDRLRELQEVHTIIREPAATWLPHELRDCRVVRLSSLFTNVADRLDNYERIAAHVVREAAAGKRVAYICYGSPVVYDRVVGLIGQGCAAQGVPFRIVPATSSVDASLAHLGEDMAPGMQICEAKWLVEKALQLEPRLATFLFQIGAYSTDGIIQHSDLNPERLASLRDYLLRFYGPDHVCVFVRAPFDLGDPGHCAARALRELTNGEAADMMDTSLYIPAVEAAGATGGKFCTMARMQAS